MDTTKNISSHAELALHIMHLKSDKFDQEEELKHTFKEFVYTLSPSTIIKDSLHELAADKEVKFDLAKMGMNMGANFIIDQVLGRNRSIKGFIGSVLVEKLSSMLINNNTSKILAGITKLIPGFAEKENNHSSNGHDHRYN